MLRGGWALLLVMVVGCSGGDFSATSADDATADDAAVVLEVGGVEAAIETGVEDTGVIAIDAGCPPPSAGTLHVSPKGSDTLGNGADVCPFKTIKRAIGAVPNTTLTTITLHHTSTPSRYGDGCTEGPPCDVTPIEVPASIGGGVVIQGDGAASAVEISGGNEAVLIARAAGFGLAHVTLVPTKTGLDNGGGHGLVIDAAAAATERAVSDVAILGKSGVGSSTGSGIVSLGAARPTLGPNLRITGGFHAIYLQGSTTSRLTGAPDATTVLSGTQSACIRLASLAGSKPALTIDSGGGKSAVTLDACGLPAALAIDTNGSPPSTFDMLTITKAAGIGLLTRGNAPLTVNNVRIDLSKGSGIQADGNANLTLNGGTITQNGAHGVFANGMASVTLKGTIIDKNGGDGVRCDATSKLVMKDASTLANAGSGLHVVSTCSVDLGASTLGGNNTFNTTSQKNFLAGLCRSGGAPAFAAASSVFSCGHTAATCSSAPLPTRAAASGLAACASGVDISEVSGAPIQITTPGHLCCK